jgi:hypothetical protein
VVQRNLAASHCSSVGGASSVWAIAALPPLLPGPMMDFAPVPRPCDMPLGFGDSTFGTGSEPRLIGLLAIGAAARLSAHRRNSTPWWSQQNMRGCRRGAHRYPPSLTIAGHSASRHFRSQQTAPQFDGISCVLVVGRSPLSGGTEGAGCDRRLMTNPPGNGCSSEPRYGSQQPC